MEAVEFRGEFRGFYRKECVNCKTFFEVDTREVRAKEVSQSGCRDFIIICPICGTHLVFNALELTGIIKVP